MPVAQEIFYSDPTVLYVSLHASNDYPCTSSSQSTHSCHWSPIQDFTGSESEQGSGAGLGFNMNYPLPKTTTGDKEYCSTLQNAVWRISTYSPEYLLVRLIFFLLYSPAILSDDHLKSWGWYVQRWSDMQLPAHVWMLCWYWPRDRKARTANVVCNGRVRFTRGYAVERINLILNTGAIAWMRWEQTLLVSFQDLKLAHPSKAQGLV